MDPGYLKCLHRPNVTLTFDAIDRVVPQGVQLKTGEVIPLDVLIFGTGFSLVLSPHASTAPSFTDGFYDSCPHVWRSSVLEAFDLTTIGSRRVAPKPTTASRCRIFPTTLCFSVRLKEGLATPVVGTDLGGSGPNSAGGHASVIFVEEVQVRVFFPETAELHSLSPQIQHTMQLIKPILAGTVRSVAVREEASAKYNSWVQARLKHSVWNFCDSWYRRYSADGKITATFPGPVTLFWWLARRPRYADYEVVFGGEERWPMQLWVMAIPVMGVAVLWGVYRGNCMPSLG